MLRTDAARARPARAAGGLRGRLPRGGARAAPVGGGGVRGHRARRRLRPGAHGGILLRAVGEPARGVHHVRHRAGAAAGGRGPVAARNYDWAVSDLCWCRLERHEPPEGPRRIGYTHHWAGCPDVLSERGLYVAIASLPAEPVRAAGVQWSILVDALSEGCATVAEAVSVCGRARHLRPMSYLLADAEGEVAVVEATPGAVRVRRPEGGVVLAANGPLGGDLLAEHGAADYEPPLGPPEDAHARAARGRAVRPPHRAGAGAALRRRCRDHGRDGPPRAGRPRGPHLHRRPRRPRRGPVGHHLVRPLQAGRGRVRHRPRPAVRLPVPGLQPSGTIGGLNCPSAPA